MVTKKKQTGETTRPSTIAVIGAAKPEAGVIATRPATAPVAAPSSDGLLVDDLLDQRPGDRRRGGRDEGVDEGDAR